MLSSLESARYYSVDASFIHAAARRAHFMLNIE